MKVVTGTGGENLGTCRVVGSLFQGKLVSEHSQGEMGNVRMGSNWERSLCLLGVDLTEGIPSTF